MSKPRWTTEQQAVIDSRGGNLLVAAAAGSGKTAVLVQRIINMITDPIKPIDIDKLLVVTFTNAAAAEMKERVQNAIEKLIQSDGDNKQLKRQLVLLEQASITTIHSFCLEVIKEYFFKIDLSPDFRIGSEQECTLFKIESMNEVFEELYEEGNEEFLALIDRYASSRGDNNIKEMILSMYSFVVSSPTPGAWLDNSAKDFDIDEETFDFLKSDTGQALIENIKIELEGLCENMEMIVEQTHGIAELQSYYMRYVNEQYQFNKVLEVIDSSWDNIKSTLESIQYEDYRKGMKRIPSTADPSIKVLQKSSKKIRDNCKDALESLNKEIFFRTEEDIKREYKELYPIMKSISEILKRFINRYQQKKKDINIIDFNDIEHFALSILTEKSGDTLKPSSIAKIYSEKFEEIFIDEYQDSNLTQEVLLTSISKDGNNRFMVGDIKQSIYKFRQARPDIFLEKYTNYSTDTSKDDKKILLHKNFRSRGEVLDATNYIFEHIMGKTVGGLEYGVAERLNLGGYFKENTDDKVIAGGPADLHLIYKEKDTDEFSNSVDDEDLDKIQYEARVIGNIIQDLLKPNEKGEIFKVIDKKTGEYRKVKFGDIVILLRSISGWQETIGKELGQMGIPVAIDSASGYLDSLEVRMIITILKTINNVSDDLNMAATLRSPLFNFTLDEIMIIRESNINITYYEALKNISNKEDKLGIKCNNFLTKLNEYIQFSRVNSINETIEYICNQSGFYNFISGLNNGEIRRVNIDLLIDRAEQFSINNDKDIHSFIMYLNALKDNETDLQGAKPELDTSNSVNLMTIHKSKGLEFPIVICAGMGKQFNNMDLKNTLLYHTDLGYGPQMYDTDRKITYPSIKKEALKNKMLIENLAEEIRILYVALTRPKEKLILTGMVNDIESAMEKWGALTNKEGCIPGYGILKSNTYLDWIVPSVLKHKDFKELCKDFNIEDVKNSVHPSKWTYKLWSTSDIPFNTIKSIEEEIKEEKIDIREIVKNIKENTFVHSKEEIKKHIPKSIAVTELVTLKNKKIKTSSEKFLMPKFLKEETQVSAMQIGTTVHEFMQRIDISKVSSVVEIEKQIKDFVAKGMILQSEAKFINPKKIFNFFTSDLGKRMLKSKNIRQEQPISIYIDANEIDNDFSEQKVLVNGIIDICFEEEDGIVIVDYKTDYIFEGNKKDIVDSYSIQLNMYKKAIEKMTNKPVKECYLYLFSSNESVKIKNSVN